MLCGLAGASLFVSVATYETEECGELDQVSESAYVRGSPRALTVFFFAKSPEAPSTTMTVLSLSSRFLRAHSHQLLIPEGSANAIARGGASSWIDAIAATLGTRWSRQVPRRGRSRAGV